MSRALNLRADTAGVAPFQVSPFNVTKVTNVMGRSPAYAERPPASLTAGGEQRS